MCDKVRELCRQILLAASSFVKAMLCNVLYMVRSDRHPVALRKLADACYELPPRSAADGSFFVNSLI